MSIKEEISVAVRAMIKHAGSFKPDGRANSTSGIYPSTRPSVGPLSNPRIYSDAGKFYRAVLPGGRATTIYLRNSGTPNLAIPSEGWTPNEAKEIAKLLFESKDTNIVHSGTVAGATADQISREILAHDRLHRRDQKFNWADFSTRVGAKILKRERNPFEVADIRGLPKKPNLVQRLEQWAMQGAANRAVRDNQKGESSGGCTATERSGLTVLYR